MTISLGLQDGLLKHYLEQARASDGNVEPRLDREPFDYRECMKRQPVWDLRFDPRPVKTAKRTRE